MRRFQIRYLITLVSKTYNSLKKYERNKTQTLFCLLSPHRFPARLHRSRKCAFLIKLVWRTCLHRLSVISAPFLFNNWANVHYTWHMLAKAVHV